MSGARPTRRGRHATEQEISLWKTVNADTVLSRIQKVAPAGADAVLPAKPLRPRKHDPSAASTHLPFQQPAPQPLTRFIPKPHPVDALLDRTPGLDRNTAKSLRRGERSPDARLDLHGMTADRAHAALMRFILGSRSSGLRCVLVITGKGREYTLPSQSGFSMERSVGVLRRDVPRWLREHPLNGAVIGVYPAHRKHGGEGAFYVYLRKAR